MYIHIPYLKKQLDKRKEQKLYEIKPFGSAIRFKRLEMKMTLEEAAEGICSVSYLSKLENNLIAPGERFLKLLIDRFALHESFDIDLDQYENDKQTCMSALLFESKLDSTILSTYEKREDYQAYLIQMTYAVINHMQTEAFQKYNLLRGYVINLKDDEIALYFILSSIMLYRDHRYSEGYELLNLVPELANDTDEHLNLLLTKLKLVNAYKMNKSSEISISYPYYTYRLIELQYFPLLQSISLEQLKHEAYFQPSRYIKKHMSKMVDVPNHIKEYIQAKAHFYKQKYTEVYHKAIEYYKDSECWLVLYLMTLDQLGLINDIVYLINHVDELKHAKLGSKILLNHFRYKYMASKEDLLNYLRRTVLGFKHISDDYQLLDYIMTDAQNLFSKHQYYKEAVQVMKTLIPRLKTLNQAN